MLHRKNKQLFVGTLMRTKNQATEGKGAPLIAASKSAQILLINSFGVLSEMVTHLRSTSTSKQKREKSPE